MRPLFLLVLLLGIQISADAQQRQTIQPPLLNTCLLATAKPSADLSARLNLSKEFKQDEKKAKGLLIGGCVSIGVCAGLVIAGTTLATQSIGAYTEGIAFIGAGLGAGLVSIPLIVLSKKSTIEFLIR